MAEASPPPDDSTDLEKTSQTNDKSRLFYAQESKDVREDDDLTTAKKTSLDKGKSERNLKSNGTSDGTKKSESVRDSVSDRTETNKNVTSRTSSERANIAFNISFSIPLVGTVPASNC